MKRLNLQISNLQILNLQIFATAILLTAGVSAFAQGCQTRDEIPAQVRTASESAAQQVFDQAVRGDVNALKASAIPSLQSNFGGVSGAVTDNKAAFSGARAQLRTSFLIDTGGKPSQDGRFYCGVFGVGGQAANSAEFDIPGLPVGKYVIVIQDFIGAKGPYALTTIFQEVGGWKLAGFYVRPETALGHDGIWFLDRARDYKAKGQNHNALFYYWTSWDLLAPVTFMQSALLSKITQESTAIQPKDVPSGTPVNFSANGKSYNITDMTIQHIETLDLSIKYSVPSGGDFAKTAADARSLATALVAQYPELKDAFSNIWVHAIDPNGGDVVGLLNLKK
jgi:hypothetical protein